MSQHDHVQEFIGFKKPDNVFWSLTEDEQFHYDHQSDGRPVRRIEPAQSGEGEVPPVSALLQGEEITKPEMMKKSCTA